MKLDLINILFVVINLLVAVYAANQSVTYLFENDRKNAVWWLMIAMINTALTF